MRPQGSSPEHRPVEPINESPAPSTLTQTTPEPAPSLDRQALAEAALAHLDGGLSIIPINARKIPILEEWKPFQEKRATRDQVKEWLRNPQVAGFAAVGGAVSGGLTVLDFDVAGFFEQWAALAEELAKELPIQRTGGGGFQVAFRSTLDVGNEKLAYAPAENREGREIAIETKGEGGYAVLPPSFCHLAEKRGKRHQQPYRVIHGDFGNIPTISEDQARHLLEVARGLCQAPLSKKQMQEAPLSPKSNGGAGGVIGAFNAAHDVGVLLAQHGYERRGSRYLAPDSTTGLPGVHIFEDTGRCYSHHSNDPLNDGHCHDAFSVFCLLEHGGDVRAAVKAAAESLGLPLPDCRIQVSQKALISTRKWPDPPAQEAFHGLVGEFVRLVEPHTESDPAALLLQFLTGFGNLIGKGAYAKVEADTHYCNLYVVAVGETSKSRKGTSWGQVKAPLTAVDPSWRGRVKSGLSSGEGLIFQVRDPIIKKVARKVKGQTIYEDEIVDSGEDDKRLLVVEAEFANVLRQIERQGNILSAVSRDAWDTGDLATLTKNSPTKATGAHVSIIGHITREELRRYLTRTEAGNGFGNRHLWFLVKRSKILPEGGRVHEVDFAPFLRRLRAAAAFAAGAGEVTRDPEARALWAKVYPDLSEGKPGMVGALTSRAEAQVLRLSMIYALLDGEKVVRVPHLLAALGVWDCCEASVRFIFGQTLGDPVADGILEALQAAPHGLTRTEIYNLFSRHQRSENIQLVVGELLRRELISIETVETAGRPTEKLKYTEGAQ